LLVAVTGVEGPTRLALAKAFRETSVESRLNLSLSGDSGFSRQVGDGLKLALGDRSGVGVDDCLEVILNLGRNPNARESDRHMHRANLGMSDIVDLCLGDESSLEMSELFREGGSLGLHLGQGIVNDFCDRPNADEGGRFHDCLNFSLGDELRLNFP